MITNKNYKARFKLDPKEVLKGGDNGDKYIIVCENRIIEISNLEYECDIEAVNKLEAFHKVWMEGAFMTRGLTKIEII